MHDSLDQPSEIRKGEELNTDALQDFLKAKLNISEEITISQFPSGYSNLTYFVSAGSQEWVLRRPPFGANIKSAHDMSREFQVLSLLKPCFPSVPTPVLYEEDESIIGAPFYLMERVSGVILRNTVPKGIELSSAAMRGISEGTVEKLIELHNLDLEANNLSDFGKPEGYTRRQVEGWSKRYRNAQTDTIYGMDEAMEWLNDIPEPNVPSFIHNDYKYDNLVLRPEKLDDITAILDWEMATVGDPLMDLGTTLGYWCEDSDPPALKPFNLTWIPGNLTREEVATKYLTSRKMGHDNILFYYVFGCFKIGVIVQQIYARFKQGLTKDPRFAQLLYVVQACGENCSKAIKFNRISNFK